MMVRHERIERKLKTKCIYVRVQTGTDRYEDFTTTKETDGKYVLDQRFGGSLGVSYWAEGGLRSETVYAHGQWVRAEARYCSID